MYQTRDYIEELALITASAIQRALWYDFEALENYQPNEESEDDDESNHNT